LPADLLKNVDEVRPDIEQAEFEDGKQTAGAGTNDDYVGFDRIGHALFLWPGGCDGGGSLALPDYPAKKTFGSEMQARWQGAA
jgi:hypothetical protein